MSLELKSKAHQNNLKEVKAPDPNIYEFEDFLLDASHLMLSRRGGEELPVTPKQVETLLALIERNGEIVAIDVLMDRLWPNAFVEESNLIQNIHILRKTLGATASGKPMIETLRRRGYRFNGEVRSIKQAEISHAVQSNETAALFKFPTVVSNTSVADRPLDASSLSRHKWFIAGAAVLLVASVLTIGYYFYFYRSLSIKDQRSIAVLPLKPINSANRDEIYENGIADALIQRLASIKGFVVRPLSGTRKYADIEQDAVAAGKEQMVDYVLASNYQLANGKVKITSQLINVVNGQVEETYKSEKDAANLFAMQDAIAADVAALIQKRFVTTSSGLRTVRGTIDEEAYRFYLQGVAEDAKGKTADFGKAIEYLENAVRIDPAFALAHAELAGVHTRGLNGGGRRATESYLKAKAAVEKALEIDDTLAEAHSYLGLIKTNYEWDFAGAEREHKRAIELKPNSSDTHGRYAALLAILGRPDESIEEMRTAIDLEPASITNHHLYGWILFQSRRYDEAIREEQRVVEMDPTIVMANNVLSNSFDMKGDDDRSFEYFLRLVTLSGRKEPDEVNLLKATYARSGWRGVNEWQLEQELSNERNGKPNYANLAGLSIELGHNDRAIDYLEKAVDQNRFTLITLKVNPRYDPLRSDTRFDDLLRRVGLK